MRGRLRCSFCGKPEDKVGRLIAGPKVHICDACVGVCNRILDAVPEGYRSWDEMDTERLLSALTPANAALKATRQILQTQVEVLRSREVSWAEIGNALGISRQAAWDRFAERP
jgi:hypothetical protein